MAESWLRSYPISAPEPVPWGWNPAATFQKAYEDAQENQRAQQEFEMAAELQRILLPAKAAEAAFNIKKFAYESENLTNAYKLQSELIDERRRILRSGGGSSGSGSTVQGSGNKQPSRYGGAVAGMVQSYLSGGGRQATGGGARKLGQGHTGE